MEAETSHLVMANASALLALHALYWKRKGANQESDSRADQDLQQESAKRMKQENTKRVVVDGAMDQLKLQHWEPKHRIFLSHSGVQKPFTEHLCERLEAIQHHAFFDKRLDSLRKGEKFYSPLMKAAEECLIAILVLSDEFFTKSKWPMMELNTFVKAQESSNTRLKILPLFFKISREEFVKKMNGPDWRRTWEDFKRHDDSINISDWMYAVSKIQGNNGIEYAGESEGEAEFIKKVVAAVCKLDVPPDVKWDTSHLQSMEILLGVLVILSFETFLRAWFVKI